MKRPVLVLIAIAGLALSVAATQAQVLLGQGLYVAPSQILVVGATKPQMIQKGTTITDVTFSPAFSATPDCVCSASQAPGLTPDSEDLICVPSATTLDVDVTGGGDPSVNVDYICVGDQ